MPSRLTLNQTILRTGLWVAILAPMFALALPAQGQTFSVLHNFMGGVDGLSPEAGLTVDARGRLYGTTANGGLDGGNCGNGCGVVFRLASQGSGWTLDPLYKFRGPGNDGAVPIARPVFAPSGILYGTTDAGGAGFCEGPGCGTAYGLRPGATACTTALCSWTESMLFSFGGVEAICEGYVDSLRGRDGNARRPADGTLGSCPGPGDLTFDHAGNIYGTIPCCNGAVYQLIPGVSATALYYFSGGSDGGGPESGVIFDSAGNLYGTTTGGGSANCGTVYELSPNGSGWTEAVLYSFQCGSDGESPVGGLIFDASGNLYGTTSVGGAGKGGTVFELTPSGSNWTFQLLYSLNYSGTQDSPYPGPTGILAMDASGSLYGTAVLDGAYEYGSVFKLTPSNGGWTYASLHDFTGGDDGGDPYGNVTFDTAGNMYGTASIGGTNLCFGAGCGVVWEITP
jgi:uncharacterized repeat protein (TIGR03803 family)